MKGFIPSEKQVKLLWDKYNLPDIKRVHSELIARLAIFLANRLKMKDSTILINNRILKAAALLHDIDKNILKLPGEQHPDTGVRILFSEGMDEVASLVKTHPLHAILDPAIMPKSWEEKILFLADKMVKHEIITVDKRFELWNSEHLPVSEQQILDAAYPKVKKLEADIFNLIQLKPEDVTTTLT